MKKKLVPELRLPEFSGEWEEKRLGEMLYERNDQIPENEEYPLMSFVQGSGVTPKSARYDRSFLVRDEQKKYKKTELGDFIYSSNNLETGSIGLNKTGKAVISPVYSIFSSKKELESQFVGIMAQRKEFIAKMIRYRQGVVYGQWRIHESDFLNIKVIVPSHEEQKKIIEFFSDLDNLIIFHQLKLETIENYKRGMMQKIFPKKGENVPELRFKGFTDPWEQRKFFELVNRISMNSENKVLPRVEYEDIISGQGILNKDLYLKENNKKGNEFKENDILFGYLRPYLDNRLLACFNGIAVGDWWVLRSQNCNVDFIYSLIQTQKFQSIANLSTGTKMPRANWSTVASAEYLVPSNIKEQSKIGTFFSNLDNLITLHQRKLEELKELKKGFMQKMFI